MKLFNKWEIQKISNSTGYDMTEWTRLADFLGIDKSMDKDARSEATYFACLKILSEAVGKLPLKLLRKTKIVTSSSNQGFVSITDESGKVIANVINRKKYTNSIDARKDEKRFFSRIDDINHNFSKRRHSK